MQQRTNAWVRDYGLNGRRYHWSLDEAQMVFPSESDQVVADICVLGSLSVSEGTFLWAWANEAIPSQARRGLERVREFGEENALDRLAQPEWSADRADGLEMTAVAAKLLNAEGVWVAPTGDVTLFFALSNFRRGLGRPGS